MCAWGSRGQCDKVNVKDESGISGNLVANNSVTVRQARWNNQMPLATHAHACYPLIKTFNDVVRTQIKGKGTWWIGTMAVVATIEFNSIGQPAGIVDK